MDFDITKFKQMPPTDLIKLVEHLSDEYRAVITVDEYYDAQTGACAVLQKKGGGADTRKFNQMNSGLQSERRVNQADQIHEVQDWAKKNGYDLKPHAEMVEPGPIGKQSKRKTSSYTKAPDGSHVPYDPKAKFGADGELTVLKHHAEMKILHWAEANGDDVVALAPTRGCCPNCHKELSKVLGGEEKFKSVVPPSRQTREAQTLQRYFYETTSAAVGPKVDAMHRANPAISNEAVFDGLKAHAVDVLKPVAAAGEKLAGSCGYRSEAVVQALEGKNSGKHQSGQKEPGGIDDPLTTTSVVGKILGDKPGSEKKRRGLDPNQQHTSPLDRQHD